ncbi:hypothetical protein VIGAN_07211000 [Vigna angularis var. angularis]|uniref:Uncharacterized protein n=1 Tax=Vigna angularis var. angularis TaxID=157739 RepID=A0A0S3SK18_PHAAN|nr:hypothetical protein VIGAN_07211000 [Vigna angularis var. angularis]
MLNTFVYSITYNLSRKIDTTKTKINHHKSFMTPEIIILNYQHKYMLIHTFSVQRVYYLSGYILDNQNYNFHKID